jgi:hypothetical protein
METTTHTPGPWLVRNHNEVVADNEHESYIAEVFDQTDNWRANARLIAAAPMLLDLCRVQLENWQMLASGEWDGSSEGIQLAIDNLQDAIAKAA